MDTNKNYPSWLVPIDIARKLKELGFKERCIFVYDEQQGLTIETSRLHESVIAFDELLFDENDFDYVVSVPTYEQVFEWFASRGWLGVILHLGTSDYSYRVQNRDMLILAVEDEVFSSYTEARESLIYEMMELYEGQNVLVPIKF
jgi:hypothetical protein